MDATSHLHDVRASAASLGASQSIVLGTSLLAYLVFKRYEPKSTSVIAALLLGVPAMLSTVLYQTSSHLSDAIVTSYTAYWSLLLLFTALYRLSPFHPLATFPGPIPARVSKLWITKIMYRGKVHLHYRELHKQYGDVVRIGPNELSICNADAVYPVLGAKGLKKGPFYTTRQQPNGTTSLLNIVDPVEHAARRRTWNRAMNSAALKDYEDIVKSKVNELMECLAQRQSQVIDISDWMSYFGFDFMGRMAFGKDFGMLRTGSDNQGVWHMIEKGTKAFSVVSYLPWLAKFLTLLPQGSNPIAVLRRIANENVMHRIHSGSQSRDLFHYLMDEDGIEPTKPSLPIVMSDGLLAIIAGSDTTSTALSHLWYFLIRNPNVYKRLRQEVDAVFPPGDDPLDFKKHVDMEYLNACINETLRLLPPVLDGVQRSTWDSEAQVFGSIVVPPNTAVAVSTYSLHRDARNFTPLPDTFWPDRWLVQDDYILPTGQKIQSSQLIHNRNAFIPFSFGPANCVGKNLAVMELRAVTCSYIQKFDMNVAGGYDLDSWEDSILDYGVTSRGHLLVHLKARY
ncbi:hypothetical protein NM688_g6512 [Phlebia brevispora]|uniref:Uncharacterized protein n=1 Tax=Phlebia brevispora TaxID=194682 RepID=A0ACC1SFH3_9APHY|nr:hypothetical protein NM688_g6512 [Phlebia brevispora]